VEEARDESWNVKFNWRQDDQSSIEMKMRTLHRFAESLEKCISEQVEEIENDLQNPSTGRTDDEIIDLYDNYVEIKEEFQKILKYGSFVYSFSLFERSLTNIADHYIGTRNLPPHFFKNIKETRKFLKNTVGIKFPDQGKEWQYILLLWCIRNQIIHHEGELPKNTHAKRVKNIVEEWNSDSSLDNSYTFELSQKFIFRVLDTFNKFLKNLFEVLPEK